MTEAKIEVVHKGFLCDGCKDDKDIVGVRWRCSVCPDFDLCSTCEERNKTATFPVHDADHPMIRYEKPQKTALEDVKDKLKVVGDKPHAVQGRRWPEGKK